MVRKLQNVSKCMATIILASRKWLMQECSMTGAVKLFRRKLETSITNMTFTEILMNQMPTNLMKSGTEWQIRWDLITKEIDWAMQETALVTADQKFMTKVGEVTISRKTQEL